MALLAKRWRLRLASIVFLAVVVGFTFGSRPASAQTNQPPTASCVVINAVLGEDLPSGYTMQASGGTGGPYTFSVAGLPQGLSLSSKGDFSGTPEKSGDFDYTVTITDNSGNRGTVKCEILVTTPPPPGY
jgi:hypothetical protein